VLVIWSDGQQRVRLQSAQTEPHPDLEKSLTQSSQISRRLLKPAHERGGAGHPRLRTARQRSRPL